MRLASKFFTESVSLLVLSIDVVDDSKLQFLNSVERLVTDLQMFKTSQ